MPIFITMDTDRERIWTEDILHDMSRGTLSKVTAAFAIVIAPDDGGIDTHPEATIIAIALI